MSKESDFLVYCIQEYGFRKGLSGKETVELFDRYSVMEYIMKCYGALHVMGSEYIFEDIESLISERSVS